MSAVSGLRERLNRSEGEVDAAAELPIPGFVRVNLLPTSVAEKANVRKAKRIAAVAVVSAVAATGGLWFLASLEAAAAERELEAAQAEGAVLQTGTAELSAVPAVFAAANAAEAALVTTMGREVRWSFLLNQLSFSTPSGVTLASISGKTGVAAETPRSANFTEDFAALLPPASPVGSMTFAGQADSFNKVASWLDSLQVLQDYTFPFLTNATESAETSFDSSVDFNSTAELTAKALSGRYAKAAPADTQASTPPKSGATPTPKPSSSGSSSSSPSSSAAPSPSAAQSQGSTP